MSAEQHKTIRIEQPSIHLLGRSQFYQQSVCVKYSTHFVAAVGLGLGDRGDTHDLVFDAENSIGAATKYIIPCAIDNLPPTAMSG